MFSRSGVGGGVTKLKTAVHGCTWLYTCHMATQLCTLYTAAQGYTGLYMAAHSCMQPHRSIHGCTWLHTSIHVYTPHTLSHKHTHPQNNRLTHSTYIHHTRTPLLTYTPHIPLTHMDPNTASCGGYPQPPGASAEGRQETCAGLAETWPPASPNPSGNGPQPGLALTPEPLGSDACWEATVSQVFPERPP